MIPLTLGSTVLIEYIPSVVVTSVVIVDPAGTGCHVTVLIHAVIGTVDLVPGHQTGTALVVRGTVVVSAACGGLMPLTGNQLAVSLEFVGHIAVIVGGDRSVGSGVEVVPVILDLDPATNQLTGNSIVSLFANNHQAGGVGFLAAGADQLAVNCLVSMAGGGNNGTPVNDGITDIAVGSSDVASLGAGGCLVFHSLGRMLVPAACLVTVCTDIVKLGHGGEFHGTKGNLIAIGFGQQALLHIGLHSHQAMGQIISIVFIGGMPHTDRQLSNHSFAGGKNITSTGNDDGSIIGLAVNGVGGGEALGQHHMIQLPIAVQIQIDHHLQGLNLFNGGCCQVHPVQGLGRQVGQLCIHRSIHDGILCIAVLVNHNGLFHISGVTILVSSLNAEHMGAVCQGNIAGGDKTICCAGGAELHAVHIHSNAGSIQTGCGTVGSIVSDAGGNRHSSLGDGLTGHLNAHVGAVVSQQNLADDGRMIVIHCGGVVNGDIIQIVDDIRIVVGVLCGFVIRRAFVVIAAVQTNLIQPSHIAANGIDRNGEILPAGAINKLMAHLDGNCTANIPFCAVGTLGDVHPEADRNRISQVNVPALVLGLLPAEGLGRIGSADDLHGIRTILDFTVFSSNNTDFIEPVAFFGSIASLISQLNIGNTGVTLLEIINDLGGLAEGNVCSCGDRSIVGQRSGNSTFGNALVGSSGKHIAVQCAHCRIGQSILHIAVLQNDLMVAVLCYEI